jgi:hypothetical protein
MEKNMKTTSLLLLLLLRGKGNKKRVTKRGSGGRKF